LTHPPDIILIFDTVIAHNGDEPLKDYSQAHVSDQLHTTIVLSVYSRLHVSELIANHHQASYKGWYTKNSKLH